MIKMKLKKIVERLIDKFNHEEFALGSDNDYWVRHDGSVAHLNQWKSSILIFNPSCDGISSLETLNWVIG